MAHSVMRQFFQTAIQTLYPPLCLGCGDYVETDAGLCGPCWRGTPFIAGALCDACGAPLLGTGYKGQDTTDTQFCQECHETPRPWSQGRAALLYQDRGRHLVLALKHGDRMDIAEPAGHWMARFLDEFALDTPLLLPIPLHPWRHIQRRYNQADLLARAISRTSGQQVISTALERRVFTRPLEKASYEERFERLSDTIIVNPKVDLAGRDIVIIDDVITSGATLSAATVVCLEAQASRVCVLALARAVKSD